MKFIEIVVSFLILVHLGSDYIILKWMKLFQVFLPFLLQKEVSFVFMMWSWR